jgi:hypothetical protein
VLGAALAGLGREPGLADDQRDGRIALGERGEHAGEPARPRLVAHRRDAVARVLDLDARLAGAEDREARGQPEQRDLHRLRGDAGAEVVLQPEPVDGAGPLRVGLLGLAVDGGVPGAVDRAVDERVVERVDQPVARRGVGGVVGRVGVARRLPVGDRHRQPDDRGVAVAVGVDGVGGVDRAVHRDVRGDVVLDDRHELAGEVADRDPPGRELAAGVGREQVVDRLVERAPLVDEVAVLGGEQAGVLAHLLDDLRSAGRVAEAAQVGVGHAGVAVAIARIGDPHRVREVVDRDDRVDPGVAQRLEQRAVVRDRGGVDLIAHRLDPRPLDAEPVGVEVHRGDQGDVVDRAGVAAAGVADERLALAEPALGLGQGPQVPVGRRVQVLDLGRGAGGAEPPRAGARRAERADGAERDRIRKRLHGVGVRWRDALAGGEGEERGHEVEPTHGSSRTPGLTAESPSLYSSARFRHRHALRIAISRRGS